MATNFVPSGQSATDIERCRGFPRPVKRMVRAVQDSLTPDLLKKRYRGHHHRLWGHCYAASEAVWHMQGARRSGLVPVVITWYSFSNGKRVKHTHWYLRERTGRRRILDVTAGQFEGRLPYRRGRNTPVGFLTRKPSKRAQIVIKSAKRLLKLRSASKSSRPSRAKIQRAEVVYA